MAKQIEKPVVNRNAVNAITAAVVAGLRGVNATGTFLTQVCEVSRRMYRGAEIPAIDVTEILADLSTRMGWKQGASGDNRRSEAKAILRAYHLLPEAMAKYKERAGACTWHNGIALARLVNGKAKGNVARAVTMYLANRKGKDAPKTAGDAKASAATAIKRVLKLPHLPRAFTSQLKALCAEYNINV